MNSVATVGRRSVRGFLNPSIIRFRNLSIGTTLTEEGQNIQKYFKSQFLGPDDSAITEINSACFQRLSKDELKKFLPENQSKYDGSNDASSYWMIRDSSKTLCQLLDHSRKFFSPSISSVDKEIASVTSSSVDIPRYSKGKEWSVARSRYFRYGKDLTKSDVNSGNDSSSDSAIIQSEFRDESPDKIVITGERGVGKSTILDQMVMHARKNDWLCLYVQNGWDQVQSGLYVRPITPDETVFDNLTMTKTTLRSFFKAHKDKLSQLPITRTLNEKYIPAIDKFNEEWRRMKKFDTEAKGNFIKIRAIIQGEDNNPEEDRLDEELLVNLNLEAFNLATLHDLVLFGLAFSQFSGSVFRDLVQELQTLTSFPVLIAVDDYNVWFDSSAFMYKNRALLGFDLAVPNSLKFLDVKKANTNQWKLKNGLCVAATTLYRSEGRKYTFFDNISSLPFNARIACYNKTEYLSAFSYYSSLSFIEPCFSLDDFLLFRTFTGSNPERIHKEAPFYFVPQIFAANEENLEDASLASVSGVGMENEAKSKVNS